MKPTLLLLHGALGSPETLHPLAEWLNADFEVKTLAFAGHAGRPVQSKTFALPYFADEVLEYLEDEAAPAHVFGYSMGGYAALLAAVQEPYKFASITTLGTKLDWSPESAAAETRFLDPEKMLAKVLAFAEQLRARHAPADWTAVVRATATLMQAVGAMPPLTVAALAGIQVPVLVLVGDADHTANSEAGAALAAQLPRGRYEVLPNTLHPLERVDLRGLSERISGMRRITDAG
ncbi:alpha/beta fold hydrolase [Hymenobacter sp. IS2118]|uniref:alpha/beta fold hydrolase n=1 Tax=Hymenobacter sp. IS2118 TaxID=1505605 RepID=UPI00054CE272|nr:alpha/beta fold hydrolase [Hymenobacter sp. IS2118]